MGITSLDHIIRIIRGEGEYFMELQETYIFVSDYLICYSTGANIKFA